MKTVKELALDKFNGKPPLYETNPELDIYTDGFIEGVVFILEKFKEIYTPSSLDTIRESIENEGMQNLISKMREELQC